MSTFEDSLRSMISNSVARMREDDQDISSIDSRQIVNCILASASTSDSFIDNCDSTISPLYGKCRRNKR